MFNYLINEIAETLQKQKKEIADLFRKKGLLPKDWEPKNGTVVVWLLDPFINLTQTGCHEI